MSAPQKKNRGQRSNLSKVRLSRGQLRSDDARAFLDNLASALNAGTFRLDALAAPTHPLHSIQIPKEILAMAEEIADLSDGPTIERPGLEFLIRFVLFFRSGQNIQGRDQQTTRRRIEKIGDLRG